MAILDQKTRIIDFQLTDFGRELLAKNQLNFKYYCFSDENVDYSGSLVASGDVSSSLNNYVHRDLSFEVDQRKDRDLSEFLYTIPHGKEILPSFDMNADLSSSLILERKFYNIGNTSDIVYNSINHSSQPIQSVVAKLTVPVKDISDRVSEYVEFQKSNEFINDELNYSVSLSDVNSFDVVVGTDNKTIDLVLSDSEGSIDSVRGFLVEVYLSGTDGILTRVYQENVVDLINDNILLDGFSNDLILIVDK